MRSSAMQAAVLRLALVFCAALFLTAGRAAAQGADIFVKLDGIKGEATDKGYEGAIRASSIHMDLKNAGGTTATGGATAGKAQFGDFVVTKPVDSSSPQLFMNCATGKLIRNAVISLRKPGGEGVEFLKYTLTDVMISSVSVSASGDAPTEQVSLSYSRIEIEYKPIGADGKAGAPVKSSYDLKSGKAVSAGTTGDVVASSGGATESTGSAATGGEAPPADAQTDAGDAAMPPASDGQTTPPPQQTEPAPTGRTRTGDAVVRPPGSPRTVAGRAATVAMFTQTPNPQLRGRLGRLLIRYPKDADPTGTHVEVLRAGEEKSAFSGYGTQQAELLPGTYAVSVSKKKVADVPVAAGSETRLHLGVLRISADPNTRSDVLDADKKTELVGGYGNQLIGLPIGTYYVRVAGQSEAVTITDGKVTEF